MTKPIYNFSEYFRIASENKLCDWCRDYLVRGMEIAVTPKYMRGYPPWKYSHTLEDNKYTPTPGMTLMTTWCIMLPYWMMQHYGKDTCYIVNPNYTQDIAIYYTTANTMYKCILNSASIGKMHLISEELAVRCVNEENIPVIVAAPGIKTASGRTTGHVAMLAPSLPEDRKKDLYVMQCGYTNGLVKMSEVFTSLYVQQPVFAAYDIDYLRGK